jgi:hypothetical protein
LLSVQLTLVVSVARSHRLVIHLVEFVNLQKEEEIKLAAPVYIHNNKPYDMCGVSYPLSRHVHAWHVGGVV